MYQLIWITVYNNCFILYYIWIQTPWPRSPSVTWVQCQDLLCDLDMPCDLIIPCDWIITFTLKKLSIWHYNAQINNKCAHNHTFSKIVAWFLLELIQMFQMRKQVTNCDLVFVQMKWNQALWPGFQNLLINSKNI